MMNFHSIDYDQASFVRPVIDERAIDDLSMADGKNHSFRGRYHRWLPRLSDLIGMLRIEVLGFSKARLRPAG